MKQAQQPEQQEVPRQMEQAQQWQMEHPQWYDAHNPIHEHMLPRNCQTPVPVYSYQIHGSNHISTFLLF
jgi:hypothetical protein